MRWACSWSATLSRLAVPINGQLFVEAPQNRKHRKTICPCRTPTGYSLEARLGLRIEVAVNAVLPVARLLAAAPAQAAADAD